MKKLLIIALALLSVSIVRADEGMWLLSKLKPLNIEKMQQMGFKLTAEDIYDVNKPGIKDAIVGLGNAGRPFRHFCSGEIISPNGLMLTNHHCGFSSIQQHSSVEHDYLKDGFVARNLGEELPNPELYVRFLLRTEDVTKRVLSAAKHAHTESERRVVVDSVMNVIGMEVSEKDSTLTGIVDAYYAGNEFWLSVYRDYNDVRLVFAPPSFSRQVRVGHGQLDVASPYR